ncbi:DEAD/DEAH box helicase family protein, partial [Aliidiomarina sp.]|uniref:DEAD/DEAH box helicase family protein n=1 Tax=Aliidiomarina sp. TaxID=1872439 RepID=UPI003A4DEF2B
MPDLPQGLYELLRTAELDEALTQFGDRAELENLSLETGSRHLAHAITEQVSDILAQVADAGGNAQERLHRQVELLNQLLVQARQLARIEREANPIITPPQVLRSISPPNQRTEIPAIGLAQPWLFTSGKDSPALLHELQSELNSCDSVDILVSFITVSGVRKIIDTLKRITALNAAGNSQTKIRIITTTYIGATDQKALDQLAALPNSQVKVSLDGRRTRLHAKAWIFERQTGFGSAYVGSANLSGAALMGGLEWTVKFTEKGQKALFSRAKAHFETLWQDEEFQTYDPNNSEHQTALKDALVREKGGQYEAVQGITTFFDIQPKPFQRILLEQLENEREHGRFRNLLVAATGTGKTVMAAFDYKRLCEHEGGQPRFLFVAHRKEILQQALSTYRHVLRDGNFGALLSGQHQPTQYAHVFTTIQSALSQNLIEQYGADYW